MSVKIYMPDIVKTFLGRASLRFGSRGGPTPPDY